MPAKWMLLTNPSEVVPLDDLREHITDGPCWCGAADDDGVLVHSAADGREDYETGRRKTN